jgi:hypothetical protein
VGSGLVKGLASLGTGTMHAVPGATRAVAHIDSALTPELPYERALAQRQAEQAEVPVMGALGTVAGTLGSGAALGPVAGAASKLAGPVLGGAATGAAAGAGAHMAETGTADETALPAAALGAAGGAGLGLVEKAAKWLANSPKVADLLAARLTNRPAGQASTTLNFGKPGQYADTVLGDKLDQGATNLGRNESAGRALKKLGPLMDEARSGQTADAKEIASALDTSDLDPTSKAKAVLEQYKARLVPASKQSELAQKLTDEGYPPSVVSKLAGEQPSAEPVSLDKLGQTASQLRADAQTASGRNSGYTSLEAADLRAASQKLGLVEQSSVAPASQEGYKDLLRRYSVASEAQQGTADALTSHNSAAYPRRSIAKGVVNQAARAVLKTYNAVHNNPNSTLGKAALLASKASPGAASAITQALSSGDPLEAAVEIHKAQGTDQDAREAINPGAE